MKKNQSPDSINIENKKTAVAKGKEYENYVAEYLKQKGYYIRVQNFRCALGEIDIIAEKEQALYFIEVKGQARNMQAEMKINATKKKRIEMASVEYVRQNNLWQYGIHYDVAVVTGRALKYYADAFEGKDIWL